MNLFFRNVPLDRTAEDLQAFLEKWGVRVVWIRIRPGEKKKFGTCEITTDSLREALACNGKMFGGEYFFISKDRPQRRTA